jgi:hypothetical protein
MLNVKDLMRLHVEALFTCDDAGDLLAVNEPGGVPAPRFFLGRTAEGNIWRFRHDVDAALARDLSALCESLPTGLPVEADLSKLGPFIAGLAREEPVRRTEGGPAFFFPSEPSGLQIAVRVTSDNATVLSPYLEEWRNDVSACSPMLVVLEGGKAVSLCGSVRLTAQAHEAGVETHADFRGRGYAARAVSAWASAVREIDRIPLYSTSWENKSSRALAKKLGLIQYGADLNIT